LHDRGVLADASGIARNQHAHAAGDHHDEAKTF
jgi:hypothetical protein